MFVTTDLYQLDVWHLFSQSEKTFFVSATQFGSAPKCHPVIQSLFPGLCYTLLPSVMKNQSCWKTKQTELKTQLINKLTMKMMVPQVNKGVTITCLLKWIYNKERIHKYESHIKSSLEIFLPRLGINVNADDLTQEISQNIIRYLKRL